MECWLAAFSDVPCDGPTDRAHLLKKEVLKRELKIAATDEVALQRFIWHPAVWVHACRFHHGQFDAYRLKVPREKLPETCERFADIFGLTWLVERTYGPHPEVGATTGEDW